MSDFKLPKEEKLKHKKEIGLLFEKGKWKTCDNLRIITLNLDKKPQEDFSFDNQKVGVSVSKKYFKKAVDRNYFKRVLRECYRLNKAQLIDTLDKKYCFMFFYQTSDKLSYQEIEEKTKQLFEKFAKTISEEK